MKVCILFIYSDDTIYNSMLQIQRKYVHKFNNVDSYFIKMDNSQNDDIIKNDDIISIKGNETLLNILYKTIKSFELLFENNYDFFVRSNISTIIDINQLLDTLEHLPKTNYYGGANIMILQWVGSGIVDNTYFGTHFTTGIGIILSNDVVKHFISNKDKIDYSIVDDISISIYLHKNMPECLDNFIKYRFFMHTLYTNIQDLNKDSFNKNTIFYRNNTIGNRNADVLIMNHIVNIIYK
jgi:hypothetical protein